MGNLLQVDNLKVSILKNKEKLYAVDDISFSIKHGEILGIVGESGCGKSLTNLAIMRLLQKNIQMSGHVLFEDKDISTLDDSEFNKLRGNDISMIFQDSISGLNPLLKVGNQVLESIKAKKKLSFKELYKETIGLLEKVRLNEPELTFQKYPHELSGGQRQRVMIAIAIACSPKLLIADEPTTSLDVTTQLQILQLLKDLQNEMGLGIILVSHDVYVIKEMCNNIIIMYAGKSVESGKCKDILNNPKHPYTIGLLKSIPSLSSRGKLLNCIDGTVPSLEERKNHKGCLFASRCNFKCDMFNISPKQYDISENHKILCHRQGAFIYG